ncbi:hypothetical protein WJ542_05560 [Paraburkholderia sp. B3]|uniref:hypothetical protein n=1 Tax=Paraburkholderia sp. B3 TaxID=3134791 RepID=UPI0039824920
MKTEKFKSLLSLVVIFVMTSFLAACSESDKPGKSEAKQAVKTALGDCQYIDVQDFKRINGIRQQDGSYVVQVSYTLDLTPPDDVKSFIKNTYPQYAQTTKESVADAKKTVDNWKQAQDAWVAANPGKTADDYMMENQEDHLKYNRALQLYSYTPQQIDSQIKEYGLFQVEMTLEKDCPNTPHQVFDQLFSSRNGSKPLEIDDFTDDVTMTADSFEIRMIKTDNGWQIAQ